MDSQNRSFPVELLLTHQEWLRRLAAYLLHDGPEAEDVVQESWEAALRSPPDPGRPARPWLAQVLRNAIRSRRRSSRRRTEREAMAELGGEVATPEQLLARVRLQERLAQLVSALEEPFRNAILLHFYDGRTAADIARSSSTPAGTVRWRISEGVRRLRERLDDGQSDHSWRLVLAPLAAPSDAPAPGRVFPPQRGPAIGSLVLGSIAVVLLGVWGLVVMEFEGQTRVAGQPPMVARPMPVIAPRRPADTSPSRQNVETMTAFATVALPALMTAAASPEFTGKRVDLDFRNANIRNVLRLLADVGHVNIWTADDVAGTVSVKVKGVPWDQVLADLCADQGLQWRRTDDVVIVGRGELPGRRVYMGTSFDPDFSGDLRAAAADLSRVGRVNIDVADDVQATIHLKGRNMPWDQVLDLIVWSKGLHSERKGDRIRIVRR